MLTPLSAIRIFNKRATSLFHLSLYRNVSLKASYNASSLIATKPNLIHKRYIQMFRKSKKLNYNNNNFDPNDIPSLNRFSSYTKDSKENNLKNILKILAFGFTFMAEIGRAHV